MNYRYEKFQWQPTNAPLGASRYDDIWFHDDSLGWAVNADGKILRTDNGGVNWEEQASLPDYLRCIGFADRDRGWVGTFSPNAKLYQTYDGGRHWNLVENLPAGAPEFICGLCVVNEQTIYAAGTNRQTSPPGILKSIDGGNSWQSINMSPWAASLVDILFINPLVGWVVGSRNTVHHPNRAAERGDLIPIVLHTPDGGMTWKNLTAEIERTFPQGEWGWKIQRINPMTLVVSTQNYRDGAILRSDDGGSTWQRFRINDRQRNSNLEGIGFLDENRGWVGGWGDLDYKGGYTSETWDRGANWQEANQVGFRLNRFRFIGDPVRVVYASGDTVYKFSDEPIPPGALSKASCMHSERVVEAVDIAPIEIVIPQNAGSLNVLIWDRFGDVVRNLIDENSPGAGTRLVGWDFRDSSGNLVPSGPYIVRVTIDGQGKSTLVYHIVRPEPDRSVVPDLRAEMLQLIASKRNIGRVVHGSIVTTSGSSLSRLFAGEEDDAVLNFLETGTSQVEPYAGQPLIVPGSLEQSAFLQQIERGAMAGQFSAGEIELVRNWILSLGQSGSGVKLDPEMVAKAEQIDNVEALREVLQQALLLEHATIPPYLTAMYSLHPQRNRDIRRRLRQVAIDEMSHLGMIGNLLIAIGGTPRFLDADFIPKYPGPLPFGISDGLQVGLEKFSMQLVGKVFMAIEAPEDPLDIPEVDDAPLKVTAVEQEFATIGQLYNALIAAVERLGDSIFTGTGKQVTGFGLQPITNASEAQRILRTIAQEGEGTSGNPFQREGSRVRPAHYYAFEAIYLRRELVEVLGGTPPWGYSAARPIPFDSGGIYDIPSNPKLDHYAVGTPERELVERFTKTYLRLLNDLERSFNGNPNAIDDAIDTMHELSIIADDLVNRGLGLVFNPTT